MQILKAHRRVLFGGKPSGLDEGQRYHFIAGWLPWLADGVNLLFNFAALGWSTAIIAAPDKIDPPLLMFSVLPLSLFVFKIVKLVHLYRSQVGANIRQTLAAAIAGLALAHTIGLAVVKGALTRREPFFRTPKQAGRQALWQAFCAAREETLMLIAMSLVAYGLMQTPGSHGPDLTAWRVVVFVNAVPYACSLLVSLASAMKAPARLIGVRYREALSRPAVSMPSLFGEPGTVEAT
jgi:hypothetical protein